MAASLPRRDVTLAAFQEALLAVVQLAVVQMEPRGQRLGAQDRSATAQGQQDLVVRLGPTVACTTMQLVDNLVRSTDRQTCCGRFWSATVAGSSIDCSMLHM